MNEPSRNDALEPGEIRFVDNYIPLLEAGIYTIKVEQSLEGRGAHPIPDNTSFSETQEFKVSGPRFRLDPADIQHWYPPPNSCGIFHLDLPHIVLTKRSLPWERSLSKKDRAIPWMALLLLEPSEILPPVAGSNKDSQDANPTGVNTIKVNELLTPENGVLTGFSQPDSPKLDPHDDPDGELSCQVIDIKRDTFKAVMPNREELKYLVHCREVAMAQKAIPGPNRTGEEVAPGNGTAWYSVVVAGRFPSPPPEGEQTSQLNVVHLVSLEGLGKYINEPENIPEDTKSIRLVSLANWVFTCLPERGESFSELMLGLVAGDGEAALEFSLSPRADVKITKEQSKEVTEEKDFALSMLEWGYVPCSYRTRLGERTFAWYRGPFTPKLVPRLPADRQPFSSAAQAMIYDQEHGLFDLSYAVAWEIGRLLALADQRFGMLLLNRRRKAHHLVDLLHERVGRSSPQVAQAQGSETDQESETRQFQALLEGNLVSDSVIRRLVGDFAREIEPLIFDLNDQKPSDARSESAVPTNTYSSQADYYQEHDVQEFLKEIDRKELEQISEWLAHLYLLYGVPFNHLVPDERLLPPESIRFFYLDRNWLEVMLDGALSIGMHSTRDILYQNLLYDVITDAVHERIHTMRDSLLGNNNNIKKPAGNNSEGPMAGLLVRSAVVSGWPGLEVRAYRQSDGKTGPVGLLRMDRPAADVLLCIFNQVPAWIEFDEPKEGLHFGLENEKIGLRYVSGEEDNMDRVGKLCGPEGILEIERDDEYHRLYIKNMLDDLEKKKKVLGLSEKDELGPAAFALQMVKVPQQMVFKAQDDYGVEK